MRVDGAAEEGFAFDLTLKFRSGERYRCASRVPPGTARPRGLAESEGGVRAPRVGRNPPDDGPQVPGGVVGPRAILGPGVASMKPIVRDGYSYEAGLYTERIV